MRFSNAELINSYRKNQGRHLTSLDEKNGDQKFNDNYIKSLSRQCVSNANFKLNGKTHTPIILLLLLTTTFINAAADEESQTNNETESSNAIKSRLSTSNSIVSQMLPKNFVAQTSTPLPLPNFDRFGFINFPTNFDYQSYGHLYTRRSLPITKSDKKFAELYLNNKDKKTFHSGNFPVTTISSSKKFPNQSFTLGFTVADNTNKPIAHVSTLYAVAPGAVELQTLDGKKMPIINMYSHVNVVTTRLVDEKISPTIHTPHGDQIIIGYKDPILNETVCQSGAGTAQFENLNFRIFDNEVCVKVEKISNDFFYFSSDNEYKPCASKDVGAPIYIKSGGKNIILAGMVIGNERQGVGENEITYCKGMPVNKIIKEIDLKPFISKIS